MLALVAVVVGVAVHRLSGDRQVLAGEARPFPRHIRSDRLHDRRGSRGIAVISVAAGSLVLVILAARHERNRLIHGSQARAHDLPGLVEIIADSLSVLAQRLDAQHVGRLMDGENDRMRIVSADNRHRDAKTMLRRQFGHSLQKMPMRQPQQLGKLVERNKDARCSGQCPSRGNNLRPPAWEADLPCGCGCLGGPSATALRNLCAA